jgi:hypothetical protein
VVPGDDGGSDRRVELTDALERLEAPEARHVGFQHHELRAVPLHIQKALETVLGFEDRQSTELEKFSENLTGLRVVINHEGGSRLSCHAALDARHAPSGRAER